MTRNVGLTFRSGPVDLAGTLVAVMQQVADHLARDGLRSFRYDKRGVDESGGDFMATGLHDNIGDAAAAIATLRARDDIDPDRIVVIGHSEGAVIAAELAAADPRLAGVVLLAGTATPGDELLRWQAAKVSASLPRPVELLT